MAYVRIPKDLSGVKSKYIFNLTLRQTVCFGLAAAVGVPLYLILRKTMAGSAAAVIMIVSVLPFFLFALYEKNGRHLEELLKSFVSVAFLKNGKRPYMTKNFYKEITEPNNSGKENAYDFDK